MALSVGADGDGRVAPIRARRREEAGIMGSRRNQGISTVAGCDAVAADGTVVGTVAAVYCDPESGEAKWLALAGADAGTVFAPVTRVQRRADMVVLPFPAGVLGGSPRPHLGADGVLSPQDEVELLRYFGRALPADVSGDVPVVERQMRALVAAPEPGASSSLAPPRDAREDDDRVIVVVDDVPVLELTVLRKGRVRLVASGDIGHGAAHMRSDGGRRTSLAGTPPEPRTGRF